MGKILLLCDDSVAESPMVASACGQFEAVRMNIDAKSVVASVHESLTDMIAVYVNEFSPEAELELNRMMAHVKEIPFVLIGAKEACRNVSKNARAEIIADIFTPVSQKDFLDRFNRAVCKARGLPEPEPAEEEGSEKKKKEPEVPKKHILVADDDNIFLRTMNNWLHGEFRVSIVKTGQGVLDLLEREVPDLILLDYEMPYCNGVETLSEIRSKEKFADLPVIFLTGVSDMTMVKEALALKPQGYILKNTTQKALLEKVRTVLEGK